MIEKVLVFGSARTGSSFLIDCLRGHPQVLAHGEPFQTEHLEWHFHPLLLPHVDLRLRERSPYKFIKWVYCQSFNRPFIVLKIMFGQNDEILWRLLGEFDIRPIYLRRQNRLAHFASLCLAHHTNVWNAHGIKEEDRMAQIRFVPEDFERFLRVQTALEARVDRVASETGRRFMECEYDPYGLGATAGKIAEWLGIEQSAPVSSALIRLRDNRVIDRFLNPDVVMDVLSQMNRLHWVDE